MAIHHKISGKMRTGLLGACLELLLDHENLQFSLRAGRKLIQLSVYTSQNTCNSSGHSLSKSGHTLGGNYLGLWMYLRRQQLHWQVCAQTARATPVQLPEGSFHFVKITPLPFAKSQLTACAFDCPIQA